MDYVMIREVKELRERLHQIPERSLMEEQTKKELMCFLKEHTSFQVTDRGKWFYAWKPAKNAEQKKPPVAFRADMDAVCGRDGNPGHYCGHDGHCSILAGLALSLENGISPDRDIYLIFQPAEETGQGARLVSSLLSEKQIPEIYGLHNIPGYPLGSILLREGTFACASTGLTIRLTGSPSHAAYPEAGKNPGTALARLLLSIERLTAKVNREKGFVLMTLIGMEIGSDSYGVSASDGILRLTVRGEKESVFSDYLNKIYELATLAAKEGGFRLSYTEVERFPATENHRENVEKIRETAEKLKLSVITLKAPMRWSEDFGYYLQQSKGAFFGIGDGEDHAQLHTEDFTFPDEILETAISLLKNLI